jgi:hypothetical protein
MDESLYTYSMVFGMRCIPIPNTVGTLHYHRLEFMGQWSGAGSPTKFLRPVDLFIGAAAIVDSLPCWRQHVYQGSHLNVSIARKVSFEKARL